MIHHQQSSLISIQDPLSTSTNSTVSTMESKPLMSKTTERRVSFHHSVQVYEYKSYSPQDRDRMFYTREEMKSFPRAIRRYLQSVRRIECQESWHASQTNSSPRFTATGLEGFLHPEHKMKHRLQGVLSVLMEQERQYKEDGLFTPVDFDSMSYCYHMASQESQEEAHERALIHRNVVSMAA